MSIPSCVARCAQPIIQLLESLAPLTDLAIRFWVARIFWEAGLTKIYYDFAEWDFGLSDQTLTLFEYEYAVPLLSPFVAAYLGTFVELFFPVLLIIGLAGRFSAGVLFVFNIIAVISYASIPPAGIMDHTLWGILLLSLLLRGPGTLSIDHLFRRYFYKD